MSGDVGNVPFLRNVPRFDNPALCAEVDPELFFPEKGQSSAEARKVCRACAAQVECQAWAVANGEPYGVWGGFSEQELRRAHGRRTPRAEPSAAQVRRAKVAEYRAKGWTPAAIAQLLGVPVYLVWRDTSDNKQAS